MTKEITPKAKTDVATPLAAGRGFSPDITTEDLILPRIELTQALSPSVVQGNAKAGQLLNNIDQSDLGEEVVIIPVKLEKNWIRWVPRDQGGGMMWRSTDPNDPRVIDEARFGPNGEKPLATAYLNFLCVRPDMDLPMVVSFSNTSYQAGRKLLTMAKMAGGDLFSRQYKISALQRTNSKGTFYVFQVEDGGLPDKATYAKAEQLYNVFAKKEMKFDAERDAAKPKSNLSEEF